MTTGALLFAFDSEVKYTDLARICATRIKKFLDIPVSLITDVKTEHDVFDKQIIVEKPNSTNRHEKRSWYNFGRNSAFNYTPYERTLLVDTDYMVNNNYLKILLDSALPLLAHKTVQPIFKNKNYIEKFGTKNTEMWWATVVIFDKSAFCQDVFDVWKMVEQHYVHYANIFGFDPRKFRNDFALSISLLLCNGNTIPSQCNIPWPLYNVDKEIKVDYDGKKWWLEHTTRRIGVTNTDLHIMGKKSLENLYEL
jgi:hypothetical protein